MAKLPRLMSPDLPQFIEPARLADEEQHLEGEFGIASLDRLREIVCDTAGKVAFRIRFKNDDQGIIRVTGEYSAQLTLLCQRCLEPMEIALTNAITIGMVSDRTEVKRVLDPFEPVFLDGREIALLTLIEDEVLLGLPMKQVHSADACPAAVRIRERNGARKKDSTPFAVLKTMKLNKR